LPGPARDKKQIRCPGAIAIVRAGPISVVIGLEQRVLRFYGEEDLAPCRGIIVNISYAFFS